MDGTIKWHIVSQLEMCGKYVEEDFNNYIISGIYIFNTIEIPSSNSPFRGIGTLIVMRSTYDIKPECMTQLAFGNKDILYFRIKYLDTWHDWQRFATNDDLSSYLPLSGGTLTGQIFSNSSTNYLRIFGGVSNSKGADLKLFSDNYDDTIDTEAGQFALTAVAAGVDNDYMVLTGKRNGALTIKTNNHSLFDLGGGAIVKKSFGIAGYIVYASGLIIQWGQANVNNKDRINYPIGFAENYNHQVTVTGYSNGNALGFAAEIEGSNSFKIYFNAPSGTAGFRWIGIGN